MLRIRKWVYDMEQYLTRGKAKRRTERADRGKAAIVPERPAAKKRLAAMERPAAKKRPVAMKRCMSCNTSKKGSWARQTSAMREYATARLINSMNLDEMLEASKVIDMGIKGEALPVIKSRKAQEYAVRCLDKKNAEKYDVAEKMMRDLNARIISENKKTTDAVESRRLYCELMAEE